MSTSIHGRLTTATPYIGSLIEDLKKGEVKVPQFQRPFVWKESQALDLLDSIANNYPVGSLLLWKTDTKLATERNIGDFQLPETDDLTPTDYVLDGQQRLTVIYSCLGASESDGGFAAGYDLVQEAFVPLPTDHQMHIFPLRWIYDTSRYLDFRTTLKSHRESEVLNQRFDALFKAITTYQIPVVTLKHLSVEEVCPIFERINSSGTRLSTYDLMVAATWSTSFSLNDESADIKAALSSKGFADIDPNTILKCLAAIHSQSIKKEDVVGLRNLSKPDMEALVARTRSSLLKTVDLLTTEFGIYSWDFLPYEALAVVLAYIFANVSSLNDDQVRRVRQWFWRSSFSERYRGASEHFVSRDLALINSFVLVGEDNPEQWGRPPVTDVWKALPFRSNNSRSRAFALMLAGAQPRNLTNGAKIDPAVALSSYNAKEFHHIFPRAYLARESSPGEHNALANICMLAASENRRVSDQDPHEYIIQLIASHGPQADSVFESNLLPRPADFDYAVATYEQFVHYRAQQLAKRAVELCDGVI